MLSSISSKILFNNTTKRLSAIIEAQEAVEISFRLLVYYFGFSKTQVLADYPIHNYDREIFENSVLRLLAHEPIQYVLGEAEFCDLIFKVNPAVLIPRPETEELVRIVLKDSHSIDHANVLDLGTGSGCIPITIKKNKPLFEIFAADISPNALSLAHENAQIHHIKINFIEADMLTIQPFEQLPMLDIIISNPPYVLPTEKLQMLPHVLDFEPHLALFVPQNDPLKYYRAAMEIAHLKLKPKGRIYFEINQTLGNEMKELMLGMNFTTIEIIQDMNNKVRFAKGVFNSSL